MTNVYLVVVANYDQLRWDKYYANGVGEILETSTYTTEPGYFEARLLRYHIEK